MRSLFLPLALLAGCAVAALTPGPASAWGRRVYVGPTTYGDSAYYLPSQNAPAVFVNSYAAPVVPSYYAPTYSVYPTAYAPIYSYYSGPRYDRSFRAWAPSGNLYNP